MTTQNERENLPVPSQVVELATAQKEREAIGRMQLENLLMKHLIDILDPLHDYALDRESMQLIKIPKEIPDGEDNIQTGDSEDTPERVEENTKGTADPTGRGPSGIDPIEFTTEEDIPEEEV